MLYLYIYIFIYLYIYIFIYLYIYIFIYLYIYIFIYLYIYIFIYLYIYIFIYLYITNAITWETSHIWCILRKWAPKAIQVSSIFYLVFVIERVQDLNLWWSFLTFSLNSWLGNLVLLVSILFTFFRAPTTQFVVYFVTVYYLLVSRVNIKIFRTGLLNNKPDKVFANLLDGLTTLHPPLFYFGFSTLVFITWMFYFQKLRTLQLKKLVKLYYTPLALSMFALLSGGYWSFLQSTWNSWWTWDPIELVLLLLAILSTFTIHTSFTGGRFFRNFIFKAIILSILMLVMVRLGLVQSLHSFFNFKAGGVLFITLGYVVFLIRVCKLSSIACVYIFINNKLRFYSTLTFVFIFVYMFFLIISGSGFLPTAAVLFGKWIPPHLCKSFYLSSLFTLILLFYFQTHKDLHLCKNQLLHFFFFLLFFILYFFFGKILFYFNFYKKLHELEYLFFTFFTSDITSVNNKNQLTFVNQFKKKKTVYRGLDYFLPHLRLRPVELFTQFGPFLDIRSKNNNTLEFYYDPAYYPQNQMLFNGYKVPSTYGRFFELHNNYFFNPRNHALYSKSGSDVLWINLNEMFGVKKNLLSGFSKLVNMGVTENQNFNVTKYYSSKHRDNSFNLQKKDNNTLLWYTSAFLVLTIYVYSFIL